MGQNRSDWTLDTADDYFFLVTTDSHLKGLSENKQKDMASKDVIMQLRKTCMEV